MAPKLNLLARFRKGSADDRASNPAFTDGPAWRNRRPWYDRTHVAAAVGIFVSLAAGLAAHAGDILRGGAPAGTKGGNSAGGAISAQAAQANANAKDALARTTQAVQSVKAMQKAAREAAAGADNLGLNPNAPGQRLPNVPNGLTPGGLQVAPGVPADLSQPGAGEDPSLWKGANLPYQTTSGGRTSVVVRQTSDQAVLTWQTFNVGKNTTLEFDQSKGGDKRTQWVAFNKIKDPSGAPSQILGSIKADGQVYVINQNGIIFGGTSQINTHSFVASSLAINDNLIKNGLLNNAKAEFLFSAPANTTPGDVVVQAGALLSSPTTPEHVGGRIALIGPNVSNSGTIETPDGQTILAAGLQVGFVAHLSSDPQLRGLDVFVGAENALTGAASNFGLISAQRASVVLTGKSVNQMGVIDSSTSVTLNGRIDLLAEYNAITNGSFDPLKSLPPFLLQTTGTVTLGPKSVTQVLPEYSSTETAASTALPLHSEVNLRGRIIHLEEKSLILAPSAAVTLQAGLWDYRSTSSGITSTFVYSSGTGANSQPQIYLDAGAMINVAGTTDVELPMSQNFISFDPRGAELADSPLQRNGVIRGTTLQVDLRIHGPWNQTLNGGKGDYEWVGTPLGNAKGYRDLVKRSVSELTTAGGTVSLTSGGSVVLQLGSTIDVSGGWINYQGGMVETTRLLSNGQIIDISQATPDRVYDGIYTGTSTRLHAKYGISEVFTNPLLLSGAHYEEGYISGAAGGKLSITAPSMALDGTLLGNVVNGPQQRTDMPAVSALSLVFQRQEFLPSPNTDVNAYSPTPPNIVFDFGKTLAPVAPFSIDGIGNPQDLSDERKKQIILSPDLLTKSGFGKLTVDNSDGNILIPANVELFAAPGGTTTDNRNSITLLAANLTINGKVSAPRGDLKFVVYDFTPYVDHAFPNDEVVNTPVDLKRGLFFLGSQAALSTAGLIVDDRFDSTGAIPGPLAIDGGNISINTFSADLTHGSTIDVSGGLAISTTGKRTFGAGGAIEILAGQDPNTSKVTVLGGQLHLNSTLRGFSGTKGGSLTILAPLVQIGGEMPRTAMAVENGKNVPKLAIEGVLVDPSTFLLLPTDFFSQGGFQSFTIKGLGVANGSNKEYLAAVTVAPGAIIAPRLQNLQAVPSESRTGAIELVPGILPDGLRQGVSITLRADGVKDAATSLIAIRGDIVMGAGSVIRTDPFSDASRGITIAGQTATILGSIYAPGGTIQITGEGSPAPELFLLTNRALTTVHLGPNTVLSTAGTPMISLDGQGFRTGSVLNGGNITVSGNILAEKGAVLDVSGSSGILDLVPTAADLAALAATNPSIASFQGQAMVATRVDSSAGTITMRGGQSLFSDATLIGAAGGPSALGGSLVISSGVLKLPTNPKTPLDTTLTVTQGGNAIPNSFQLGTGSVIGRPVIDLPDFASSGGYITVGSFATGGFDSVNLKGTVKFVGPVNISAGRELRIADGGVIFANAAVQLSAPYVALGKAFLAPQLSSQQPPPFDVAGNAFYFTPTLGSGTLTVTASLIDVGNLSLQGIRQTNLTAKNGDIRGDGTLNVAGALVMTAAQIYPATAVSFTIAAYDTNIQVASSSIGNTNVTLASALLPAGFGVGSPLLGSTVVSIVGTNVTLASGANAAVSGKPVTFAPGTVTIVGSGTRQLPLSAGGTLNIYGSIINQGGTLVAPGGAINLGWDGTGTSPIDNISGAGLSGAGSLQAASVAVTQSINLLAGSRTSVSLIDPITKQPIIVPYGLNLNGAQWIDPTGTDITAGGLPAKSISISGVQLTTQAGSTLDVSGGGDLMSYRWVPGVGGSKDVLSSTSSFAIIPDFESSFAPYAPFNTSTAATNLGGDPGYVNSNLRAGDRIYLQAGGGLAAGWYTLLPARYALMPGAYLITPKSGTPIGTFTNPDGTTVLSGHRTGQSLLQRYEVASSAIVRSRSEYQQYFANDYLLDSSKKLEIAAPRLPIDAGHLVLSGSQSMVLQGSVLGKGANGGHGAAIDISSSADMFLTAGGGGGTPGSVVLDVSLLNSFGAESLLVGGIRQFGATGTTVTVKTRNLTLDNAGTPLTGPEILLVAKEDLTLATGAAIQQKGSITRSEFGGELPLLIGSSTVAGSGDGTLLAVSSLPTTVIRSGVSSSLIPDLTIGAGARISGANVVLDSTAGTYLDQTAVLTGDRLSINSGRISIQLLDPGALQPGSGLILAGSLLSSLLNAQTLSLLSYSTIDIYGHGEFAVGGLELHAGEIRGFNNGGATVAFNTGNLLLDNLPNRPSLPGPVQPTPTGTLRFNANTIRLGVNNVQIDQYATLELNASGGILIQGTGGLSTAGDLIAATPYISGEAKAKSTISAAGSMIVQKPATASTAQATGGLGASLTLQGSSVVATSDIIFPSGLVKIRATTGDVTVGGLIDASGTKQEFFDVTKFTNGGQISLLADRGSVTLTADGVLSVGGHPDGGDAGTIAIGAPGTVATPGTFTLAGKMFGQGGTLKKADGTTVQGQGGSFLLDVGTLPSLALLDPALTFNPLTGTGGFTYAQNIRVRLGDVAIDATTTARSFDLSADQGSITVTGNGKIDAHGATGGTINLIASGSIILENGALLTVEAADFSAAGKGGAISLEAGSQINGVTNPGAVLDIQAGSTIVLSVASASTPADVASAAALGKFTGTLHLRAPQNAGGTDLQINSIAGQIEGASNILIEGYRVYTSNTVDSVKNNVSGNAATFAGNSDAISNRIFGGAAPFEAVVVAGAEIINPTGDLTLNTDWDLSSFRFGPRGAAGVLTLRASGNLIFKGALSDGFDKSLSFTDSLAFAPLMAENTALPTNAQSWSYRLSAGADLSAADFRRVQSIDSLATTTGSLKLGVNYTSSLSGNEALTSDALEGHYQVIRTGSGDITISTGRDVQLLNPFATIYTAGTLVNDPSVSTPGDFDIPVTVPFAEQTADLGAIQNLWIPQYSRAGGNVIINAQGNIAHLTEFTDLTDPAHPKVTLIADSNRQTPTNWLYRRSRTGADGKFATAENGGDIASTTWWIDFGNFFEGVGALGGGDVTMIAGGNVSNVDAVIPTNARMAGKDPTTFEALSPADAPFIELGGGNLRVRAGGDIDGGVYYVERGHGTLDAGQSIHTNATRAPSKSVVVPSVAAPDSETWLPTTLYLGKGTFDVSARGDILLGPVVNAFMAPGGVSNGYYYKTFFSTYAPDSAVNVTSLGGTVTLRESVADGTTPRSILELWMDRVSRLNSENASHYEPWIRLNEYAVTPNFDVALSLNPGTLAVTAFSGDVNIVGDLTLSPAPQGSLDLFAAGAINGLNSLGMGRVGGVNTRLWDVSRILVSDADPTSVPGIRSTLAAPAANPTDASETLKVLATFFAESGSMLGNQASIQTKLALHGSTLLHAEDPEPVRFYTLGGNVADLTLYSPKATRILAGKDIADVGLFIQNLVPEDFSVVSAGRDIVAYNPNSPRLQLAQRPGNSTTEAASTRNAAQSGDIQISGPGTLAVLAGRDITLGAGRNTNLAADLGAGITSIGNVRNPSLPYTGADIILAAGIAGPSGLFDSPSLDFAGFSEKYLGQSGSGAFGNYPGLEMPTEDELSGLSEEQRAKLALEVFFRILRDSGRDHNLASSPNYGTYNAGFSAISVLLGTAIKGGNIDLSSHSVKTASGGNITMLAPGGGLNLGFDIPAGVPPGIVTEHGGSVSIFTEKSVQVGALRIFTLRGGNEIIWSTSGDIAAGNASKTVQTAPPTRVVIDASSADVTTDLAGLATGGGIGVLATVGGVPPGDVDLIAPNGAVDAGDAGIRATGNLSIAAVIVLNADNIQVAGTSTGVPTAPPPAAVNLGAITQASNTTAAGSSAATDAAKQARSQGEQEDLPSIITVEVLGFSGGEN